MKITEQNLRDQYESLATAELIELYTKNELTELASSVLVQVLKKRGISLENLAELTAKGAKKTDSSQEDVSTSFLDLIDYIKQYESMNTEDLMELYKESELNEVALSALNQVLEKRDIPQQTLNGLVLEEGRKKGEINVVAESVFVYKSAKTPSTPSLKAVVLTPLIYLFGHLMIISIVAFTIGFHGAVIGIPTDKVKSFIIAISPVVSLFFCLVITIFLLKRYSGYFFSGSWKTHLYSRLKTGIKWSIPFIIFTGLVTLAPEGRDVMLKRYLLMNKLSLENITIINVILISTGFLLASFLEELIFRGMIQQHIKKFLTPRLSVFITAGIFAITHFGQFFIITVSLGSVVTWFVAGIFTGFAFNRYNSCISSFIPHLVLNLQFIIVVPLMLTF